MTITRATRGRLLVVLTLAVILGACGADENDAVPAQGASTTAAGGTALEGTTWELNAQGFDLPGLDQIRPTLLLAGGMASGWGGCNRYNGPYTLTPPATLTFGNVAQTAMACGPVETAIEREYVSRLGKVAKYAMGGPGLQLQDSSGATVLAFSAASTSLEGTWAVTGFLTASGSAFTSGEASAAPTAVFGADGNVAGTTGCNNYNGPWKQGPADAVQIGPLAKTLMACTSAALTAQEESFTKALETSVRAEVTSREATLLNSAGQRTVTMTRS